jgi:formamidopyrimidine-DNA glycosylase
MPELPEVETVAKVLRNTWPVSPIERVDVFHEKMVTPSAKELKQKLVGCTLQSIERIGKHLIFLFDHNLVIISHLRMEGKYFVLNKNDSIPPYARLILHFKNGQRLVYDDMRKFGTWILSDHLSYRHHPSLAKLGVEPFDVLDSDAIHTTLKSKKRPIKTILLDQTILLGIGNIYADEILYASKIHPLTMANTLSKQQVRSIIDHAKTILNEAISAGGSYIRSYRAGDQIDGSFQLHIQAYNRDLLPCYHCHTRMKKIIVSGRGTTYCPRCQPDTRLAPLIAITGPIGSGKSYVLEALRQKGYQTYSSDQFVKLYYQQKKVIPALKTIFSKEVFMNNTINTRLILEDCGRFPDKLKKLEHLIFPYVEAKIIFLLKKSKIPLFIEIPLLFQANMDYLASSILFLSIPQPLQLSRVRQRDGEKADALLLMNEKKFQIDYREFADNVIANDGDFTRFDASIREWMKTIIKTYNLPITQ